MCQFCYKTQIKVVGQF